MEEELIKRIYFEGVKLLEQKLGDPIFPDIVKGRWLPYALIEILGDVNKKEIFRVVKSVLSFDKDFLRKMMLDQPIDLHELVEKFKSLMDDADVEVAIKIKEDELDIDVESEWGDVKAKITPEAVELTGEAKYEHPDTADERPHLKRLDAKWDVLAKGNKVYVSAKFKAQVENLPEKIRTLFDQYGDLSFSEILDLLELNTSVRGIRRAFVVAWEQVEKTLFELDDLVNI